MKNPKDPTFAPA